MDIKTRLVEEMKAGMKAGDAERVSVIRMLRATLKNKEIEKGKEATLSEDEIIQVIRSAVKQRNEAILFYDPAGRHDLVEKEKKEIAFLELFLPPPLSEGELNTVIAEAIAEMGAPTLKQMGDVMKVVLSRLGGKADGKAVSEKVRLSLAPRALS